jgi:hypothetical protein
MSPSPNKSAACHQNVLPLTSYHRLRDVISSSFVWLSYLAVSKPIPFTTEMRVKLKLLSVAGVLVLSGTDNGTIAVTIEIQQLKVNA